jgi:predicted transcriptional regulator
MNSKTDTIEIDTATAELLKARAAERGMSVAEFLLEVVTASGPAEADAADIAELDRRWARVKSGAATVPHDDVVRWLDTWGTSAFRPWRER